MRNATQCLHDPTNPHAVYKPGEGCRITGSITVNKVAGNIHISQGTSVIQDGRHIHQFNPAEAPNFNISHTIHGLSFGESFPGMNPNPLVAGQSIGPFFVFISLLC